VQAGALPGKALVVYEPAHGVVTDVFPGEDGHAQARSFFGPLLATVRPAALWIADRNFCTRAFLCDLDRRGGLFITRHHEGLPYEMLSSLRSAGRVETGHVAEHRVRVVDAHGKAHVFRRLRLKRDEAPRDGDRRLYIVTNLPSRKSATKRVARLYRKRWTLEMAFQHLEASLHSEINTLAYPQAALFGFCLALVAYNVFAVVLAALRSVHGERTVEEAISLYYVANDLAETHQGMMIAIPEAAWYGFSTMSAADLAATLRDLASRVRLEAIRKSPRGPKKPRPTRQGNSKQWHVSTAKLLMNRTG
jgi:IS4 transposase